MFRPLTLFSGIPCPSIQAREVCGLGDRCLFLHEDREDGQPLHPPPPPQYTQQQSPRGRLFRPAPSVLYNNRGLKRRGSDSGSSVGSGSSGGVGIGIEEEESPKDGSMMDIDMTGDEGRLKRRRVAGNGNGIGTGSESGSATGTGEHGGGVARKKSKMEVVARGDMVGGIGGAVGRGVSVGVVAGGITRGITTTSAPNVYAEPAQVPTPPSSVPQQIMSKSALKPASAPPPAAKPAAPSSSLLQGAVPPSLAYTTRGAGATSSAKSTAPTVPSTKLPILVPISIARSPVKWNIRQQLLTLLHAEYLRLLHATGTPQDPDIIAMAVEEEAEVARTKGGVYPNVMKSRIFALKKAGDGDEEWVKRRDDIKKKKESTLLQGLEALAAGAAMVSAQPVVKRAVGEAGGRGQFSGLVSQAPTTTSTVTASPKAGIVAPVPYSPSTAKKPATPSVPNTADTSAPQLITDPTQYVPLDTNLTATQEIKYLRNLIHPPKTLLEYGYILKPPTRSEVIEAEKTVASIGGYETCDRCSSRFRIYPGRREEDGRLASGGKCRYHWGRALFPPRERGSLSSMGGGGGEKTYSCCREPVGQSVGCVESENHVFKVGDTKRLASQWQWENINGPMGPEDGEDAEDEPYDGEIDAAFALDCEMCYTTNGMEIVRITMVDFPQGKTVLDALVRPLGEVLDLNTRFSGVSVRQFVNAKPYVPGSVYGQGEGGLKTFSSPKEARAEVLRIMRDASAAAGGGGDGGVVLIGHALENDLAVLRICHSLVVDTCILFPHSRGFPLRNKLSWAAEKFLKWKIQAGNPAGSGDAEADLLGHDSAIDARCAGELVRWKIKEGKPAAVPGASAGAGTGAGVGKGKSKVSRAAGGGGIKYDGVAGYVQRERELNGGVGGTASKMDSAAIAAMAAAAVPVKRSKGGFTVDETEGEKNVEGGVRGAAAEVKQEQKEGCAHVESTPPQSPSAAKRAHHERRTSGLGLGLWSASLEK